MTRDTDAPVGRGRRRPTQADVANLAGVSPAIVSAVVNNRPAGSIRVSQATQQRVMQAVQQLGYLPNIAARNLARGRNHILGIFSYEPVFPVDGLNFYHEFLVGIEQEAEASGYNLLMFSAAKSAGGTRSIYAGGINALQLADGSVLVGTEARQDEVVRLTNEGYPFVIIGRRDFPGVEPSYVTADYAAGTQAAVRALVELRHRKIAMVCESSEHESYVDRRTGFTDARIELALDPTDTPIWTLAEADPAERLWAELVDAGVTAVIAESTPIAEALRRVARRVGVRIPEQMSILSLGGAPLPRTSARLATLVVPRREMGRKAVELLLRLLDDPSAAALQCKLTCDLRLAGTVGPRSS